MTKPIARRHHTSKCQVYGCKLETVRCTKILPSDGKVCGCLGHPDYYKSDDIHVVMVVKHTHFLPLDMHDVGRNDFHNIKKIAATDSMKQPTWKTYRGSERWVRVPIEVKENLGWNEK